ELLTRLLEARRRFALRGRSAQKALTSLLRPLLDLPHFVRGGADLLLNRFQACVAVRLSRLIDRQIRVQRLEVLLGSRPPGFGIADRSVEALELALLGRSIGLRGLERADLAGELLLQLRVSIFAVGLVAFASSGERLRGFR